MQNILEKIITQKKEDLKKIGNNYIEERFLDKNKAILDVDSERIKLLKKEKHVCGLLVWLLLQPMQEVLGLQLET